MLVDMIQGRDLPNQRSCRAHQMELSHALNDGLVGLLVSGEVEGWVLLGQLDEALAHLLQVRLALGLDGNLDDGLWELQTTPSDARIQRMIACRNTAEAGGQRWELVADGG